MRDSSRDRRVGVMGGTFDPIHYGHLVCAEESLCQLELDEVVFIPAGSPWQKGESVSSAEDRYLLTMLATASNPSFSVSRIEVDRDGPTYTIDTLRALKSFFGSAVELFFIVGTDALADLPSWREPEGVLAEAHLVAVPRPRPTAEPVSSRVPRSAVPEPLSRARADQLTVIDMPQIGISSTEIRSRIALRRSVRYLLPPEVAQFIEHRGLYKELER